LNIRRSLAYDVEVTPTTPQPAYATVDGFAERLAVCRSTVKSLLKKGLPHVRIGRAVRIPIERADAWLAAGGGQERKAPKRAKRRCSKGLERITADGGEAGAVRAPPLECQGGEK
jgi:excisionase family DNA binding protein